MCGIICGSSYRDLAALLIDGLKRLEYRGYDSAGIALLDGERSVRRIRAAGKVRKLSEELELSPISGSVGIAHTRWATHGAPETRNAHPHVSGTNLAVVHNGIVENFAPLRSRLEAQGIEFSSDTDTEVIAHLVNHHLERRGTLLDAVGAAITQLEGAFTFAVIHSNEPDRLIVARQGTPLVIGIGDGEGFAASDTYALLPLAQRFIFMEDGDIAEIRRDSVRIFDGLGNPVERREEEVVHNADPTDKGDYRHYMRKEIDEQAQVVSKAFRSWVSDGRISDTSLPDRARTAISRTDCVDIIACGTSYHAGMVAQYWLEEFGIPCRVEVASEHRYRNHVSTPGTLLVTISQSGETADTLAALRHARERPHSGAFSICNVPSSTLVRESDFSIETHAGPEIGVASTKAFTTQLAALRVLVLALAKARGLLTEDAEWRHVSDLERLPELLSPLLSQDSRFAEMARRLEKSAHALYLGRGSQYPIAREGALKLKEVSYIHAEAYPGGELKHGPLALVDSEMPVICTLPHDALLSKSLGNLKEVLARGGKVLAFADDRAEIPPDDNIELFRIGEIPESVAPVVFTIPLQLLAYYVAVAKGADVDQPRNLAKSVTVE